MPPWHYWGNHKDWPLHLHQLLVQLYSKPTPKDNNLRSSFGQLAGAQNGPFSMIEQNESGRMMLCPSNRVLFNPTRLHDSQFLRHMHSSITIYRILSRIVSPLNVSHHLSFDNCHRKCYGSIEEESKAKGDNRYADGF